MVLAAAGPTLKFHSDLIVAVTGAAFDAKLDGSAVPLWQSFTACKGSKLTIGKVQLEKMPLLHNATPDVEHLLYH